MEINSKSNVGQNFGIAAVIIGVITFVLAIIPCLGIFAIIPGIIAVILGTIGLLQSIKSRSRTGLSIAGLVVAFIACIISVFQVFITSELVSDKDGLKNKIENKVEEIISDIENKNFSIRINEDGKRINIDENTFEIEINEDMQRRLEELEGITQPGDTLHEK